MAYIISLPQFQPYSNLPVQVRPKESDGFRATQQTLWVSDDLSLSFKVLAPLSNHYSTHEEEMMKRKGLNGLPNSLPFLVKS